MPNPPPRQLSQHEIPSHCTACTQQGAGLLFTLLFVSITAPAQHGPSSPSARAWPGPRCRWGIAASFLALSEHSWRPWHAGVPHSPSLHQPLQELLGFAEGEPRCCWTPGHVSLGSGDAGSRGCRRLSPVSWRGATLTCVSRIKGKVGGTRGESETFMTVHI